MLRDEANSERDSSLRSEQAPQSKKQVISTRLLRDFVPRNDNYICISINLGVFQQAVDIWHNKQFKKSVRLRTLQNVKPYIKFIYIWWSETPMACHGEFHWGYWYSSRMAWKPRIGFEGAFAYWNTYHVPFLSLRGLVVGSISFSVPPELISSTLFVVGGATLRFRRIWKKRKTWN